MASSPVNFFAALLVACGIGWVVFVFAARLLAWFLSRLMGASVGFRVAGCNCLRDVTVKFRKGAVESVSIGELKLSLRKSLVKLGFSFISRDPKLQVLICDLEVVMRQSRESKKKSKSHRSRSAGKGKWVVFTNMARLLSISVTELVVKVPKAVIEVKDLSIDLSKTGGSNPTLNIKLHLIPLLINFVDSRFSFDQSFIYSQTDCMVNGETCSASIENNFAPFVCEDLSIVCDLGHEREGIKIRNLDVSSGDVTINLNENLIFKSRATSETFIAADGSDGSTLDFQDTRTTRKKKFSFLSAKKHIFVFPDKVSFSMPKLDVKFTHWGQDLHTENNVTGILLRSTKSQLYEDSGETTSHFDVQIDLSEIHVFREGPFSILEILKVVFLASVDVPMQPLLPIRAEIDVKLGGTQCNVMMTRLKPWLRLHLSKKDNMILRDRTSSQERSQPSDSKDIMWTCTMSAPEMTIVLYDLNGLPLYHGCSQSSHFFANNIASKGVQVHMELGEVLLHMEDEYQECLRENLFGVETNTASLMHISRVSLDWGQKELEAHEKHDASGWKLVFSVDVTGMGLHFGFQHIESVVSTAISFKELFKSLSPVKGKTEKKVARASKTAMKGTQIFKLNLERCSINFSGDTAIEDTVVPDPKRVNFGSQGGQVIVGVSSDGTPRRASIISSLPSGCKHLKFSTSLDIFHLSACMNKEKESMQMDLERARSIFQESSDDHNPGERVTLFDMQNAKFVRRSGGLNDIAVCSLFSASDITVRWEPDVHLALFEVVTRLRFLLLSKKLQGSGNDGDSLHVNGAESQKVLIDRMQSENQHKRRESIFAVDVEILKVSAEVADGVEAMVHVQSIFSENARIGVLLEGLALNFNEARVFRSSRMQISRVPVSACNSTNAKLQSMATRDWVVQGLDVHICMPYRLPLRAIEDAVEDMLRGLKLISAAKTSLLFPVIRNNSKKVKVGSSNIGTVRFILRKITADVEEEPMQGWLDEHYQLMKNEVCESAVRLKFLEEIISSGNKNSSGVEPNDLDPDRKVHHSGVNVDASDTPAIKKLQEEIQKQTFLSYYHACQKLVFSEGSGACSRGFQAGFKPSACRTSLLSLTATELDVTLTEIEGGSPGMVDFIKRMDPVCSENDVPFSRLYGRNIALNAGSLALKLRNYTYPLLSATAGKCHGRVVFAQQATCFQPQIHQDVFVGRWRTVRMLRSASGTTSPMKLYSELPICFHNGEVSFGVGYEPAFADISYAFTVALRRANLSKRSCYSNSKQESVLCSQTPGIKLSESQPPKKERSLPWWDDMRYYIHGKISLRFTEIKWNLLATTNPYEKLDRLQIVSGDMDIQQSDGRVHINAKDFKFYLSSLESLYKNSSLKLPRCVSEPFLVTPAFSLEVAMDWECESCNPLNHYLHALPCEGEPRKKVYDPFRSTSLSLRWNFSLRPSHQQYESHGSSFSTGDALRLDGSFYDSSCKADRMSDDCPTMNMGAHDLIWIFKWWNMNYSPPHKLRSFSRWPRFGVPRTARSGNLSLDKIMTEFFLRVDATPSCIKHMPLGDDDPASGLTFEMTKLKYELCYSRGKQRYSFESKRDPLDLVYRGLDLHMLKVYLNKNNCSSVVHDTEAKMRGLPTLPIDKTGKETCNSLNGCTEKQRDEGFLLSSDYFTIRRQAPKADPARLLAWQESGRKNLEMTYVRSEFENGSESDHARSDPSDDEGFNVLIADNCQRVYVYGLKLLWTIENRDAVWSWVGGISKAFEPPKPSPSRQYAQRKFIEGQQILNGSGIPQDDTHSGSPTNLNGTSSPQRGETLVPISSPSPSTNMEGSSSDFHVKHEQVDDPEEEGTRHFMVNIIQPQFNLHSEEANGRFLLAAASGRLLARSFHSVLHVGYEMIEKALGTTNLKIPESEPEMTWKRLEFSAMLVHVQAHVAPTDVDPGAGLQWLPKILRSSPKVKRTGALLERVFMPCQMYFRYTRHKGGTADLKVKPLKELSFNSPNITATMTSRQFQVMLDVLSSLLFARLPKPRKSSLSYPSDDDEDVEEEADEVVPDGVEEVELAKINLEKKERERKLLLDDIRILSIVNDASGDLCLHEKEGDLWMVTGGKLKLVQSLKKELGRIQKSRKDASSSLRLALQKAAQQRLMEKEKNKSPSYAMRISMRINKVVWSMLADGKYFAEAEINDMIYDFDRDYKDIGVAKFTTKNFVVRNCLPNVKSNMLLSAWNAPPEWGKNVMLRVDAKQGAPKDGNSPLELFQVDIYPLKIHLTETMYRMMWDYFFPEEEQDSQRRQDLWKVSTTAGSRRLRKSITGSEAVASSSQSVRGSEAPGRLSAAITNSVGAGTTQASVAGDTTQGSKLQSLKANVVCGSNQEPRRASSSDRTREESAAESVPTEISAHAHPSSVGSSRSGPLDSTPEHHSVAHEASKNKLKDSKQIRPGRLSNDEKKVGKPQDDKRTRARKMMEFHNIKISQVELLVTYEGSRFAVNDLRLLMDTFHRDDFTGTWRRLFSRVKKHIIWGVLKSVTGMQGKKFKDKAQSHRDVPGSSLPDSDLNLSDSDGGQPGKSDQFPISWLKRPSDGAGDGFVTSIRGLFRSQQRKAKAFVLRTMRGDAEHEFRGEWSESDAESSSPFARQLTITRARKLLRRHTKRFRARGQKSSGVTLQTESFPATPRETTPYQSDSSGSLSYEDFHE